MACGGLVRGGLRPQRSRDADPRPFLHPAQVQLLAPARSLECGHHVVLAGALRQRDQRVPAGIVGELRDQEALQALPEVVGYSPSYPE
jgi:hypothetical protein